MRRILTTLILLAATVTMSAQIKEREIFVYYVTPKVAEKFKNLRPQAKTDSLANNSDKNTISDVKEARMVGAQVYSFADKKSKQAFIDKFLEFGVLLDDAKKATDMFIHMDVVDGEGHASIKAPNNAEFLVYHPDIDDYDPSRHIIDGGASGKGLGTDDVLIIFASFNEQSLGEVLKEGKMKIIKEQPSWSNEYYKVFDYWYRIDSIDADPNIRIGCYPICYEYESGGIFKTMEPKMIEGELFHKNQIKRMGYDYRKYDPLAKYTVPNHYLQTGKSDSLHFKESIGKKVKGKHYTVNLVVAKLGYDNVIEKREMMVDDGRELAPLRFIDFQVDNAEINYDRYEKRGEKQEGEDEKETNLFFKTGKWTLDADDIEGLRGLEVAKQFARDVINDENIYSPHFVIEGYASPEGNYQGNITLAQNRANYLMGELKRAAAGAASTYTLAQPKVQPWTVVADTLERRGYTEQAEQVRAICASTSDMNSQYQRIRNLEFYDFIDKSILPLLRIDRITATYTIKRVLSAEEVLANYNANKEPYIKGIGKDAYEYFHLMRNLADNYDELEPIARTAYNKFKDDFKRDSTNRPWTLAAYHLARCLIHRKAYDTEMLKPYIKEGMMMDYPSQWDPKEIRPWAYSGSSFRTMAPCNDRAIALLQIEMLCGVGSYIDALSVYINVHGLKARYPKLGLFLQVFERPQLIAEDAALRNSIAATSDWNKVVAYAACCGVKSIADRRKNVDVALKMLRSNDKKYANIFKRDDPRVHYLEARLIFDQMSDNDVSMRRLPGANDEKTFNKFFDPVGQFATTQPGSVASALIKSIMLDETFLTKELRWDKYVPFGFYLAAQTYWDAHKDDWSTIQIDDPGFADFARERLAKDKELEEKSK